MHKFAPLLYSYMLAPICFGNSLPSSGSFWICLSYMKIQIDMVNCVLEDHIQYSTVHTNTICYP
jgi:hypothetical protein